MVPNPIYEGPQYEIVHLELNTLTTPHKTPDGADQLTIPFIKLYQLMKWP